VRSDVTFIHLLTIVIRDTRLYLRGHRCSCFESTPRLSRLLDDVCLQCYSTPYRELDVCSSSGCLHAPAHSPFLCIRTLVIVVARVLSQTITKCPSECPLRSTTGVAAMQLAIVSETKAVIFDKACGLLVQAAYQFI